MAQGDYGTSSNPFESVHGEQWVYEPLTSDPSDREEGSTWFRADLDSGDKIGTFRVQNDDAGNDINDLPVFAEGESVDGVVKSRPIQTTNGEGFIPYKQEGGTFDQFRFQHSGTWYGAHDGLSAVPYSGDLHARYDATQLSLSDGDAVSTWADETGNGNDLTAGTAPTFETGVINGNAVVRFNGVDDILDVAFSSVTQPNHVFVVAQLQQAEAAFRHIIDSPNVFEINIGHDNTPNWRLHGGTSLVSGTGADTNAHIHNGLFNGNNSAHRLDGAQIASGDAGTESMAGVTLGARGDSTQFTEIDVGEVLIYPEDKSANESDVEQYLSDKWGVTI